MLWISSFYYRNRSVIYKFISDLHSGFQFTFSKIGGRKQGSLHGEQMTLQELFKMKQL